MIGCCRSPPPTRSLRRVADPFLLDVHGRTNMVGATYTARLPCWTATAGWRSSHPRTWRVSRFPLPDAARYCRRCLTTTPTYYPLPSCGILRFRGLLGCTHYLIERLPWFRLVLPPPRRHAGSLCGSVPRKVWTRHMRANTTYPTCDTARSWFGPTVCCFFACHSRATTATTPRLVGLPAYPADAFALRGATPSRFGSRYGLRITPKFSTTRLPAAPAYCAPDILRAFGLPVTGWTTDKKHYKRCPGPKLRFGERHA